MELEKLLKLKYSDLEKKNNKDLFDIVNLSADYADSFRNQAKTFLDKFNDVYSILNTPEEQLTPDLVDKAEKLADEAKKLNENSINIQEKLNQIEQVYASALDILNQRINHSNKLN